MKNLKCRFAAIAALAAFVCPPRAISAVDAEFKVQIAVSADLTRGELRPIWRFFGADEPNYASMKDGLKLLGELGEMRPGDVYFRAHNMLNTGDGTPSLKWGSTDLYNEDAQGNPIYDFKGIDRIIDSYLVSGVRPYLQLGFMPQALSTNPEPYRHDWRPGLPYSRVRAGWAYPPKDYARWGEMIHTLARHFVDKYGRKEVERWYFEVWNEANGADYWRGTVEEFCRLHDVAVDAVRRALPTARVGGPDVAGAGGEFMDKFLRHISAGVNYATGEKGTPTDFLSFHAKGAPSFVDGHVRMGIANHLRVVDEGFSKIAAVEALRDRPIVIGESDPEGCAACQGPQNGYRNGTMYSSYTAASFTRKHDLADRHGINFDGALTWAFEFEDQPYFAGFRALATNGIDLPVLNVFRMFSMMGGERVAATSSAGIPLDEIMSDGVRHEPDVAAFASRDGKRICVMVWHYHDDDVPGPDARVNLTVDGLSGVSRANCRHYRVDGTHSNSYAAWQTMGSPIAPTQRQYEELIAASALSEVESPRTLAVDGGASEISFALPRQGVSLIVLDTE